MTVRFHKKFKKRYEKYQSKLQKQINTRLRIFYANPFDSVLENHKLQGKFNGKNSINITGDMRAIYSVSKNGSIEFLYIGTHSELYK